MIVLLNGTFGVGKTSVAQVLAKTLPNALLFDPEEVGQMVRRVTQEVRSGAETSDDFQDIALWRSLTITPAAGLVEKYGRDLVVPMTLVDTAYLEEIRTGLSEVSGPLHHFCLTAPLEVVQHRLLQRGDLPGSWPWQRTLSYYLRFEDEHCRVHIATENRTPQDVAELVLNFI